MSIDEKFEKGGLVENPNVYPSDQIRLGTGDVIAQDYGIKLRDQIAMKAMQALIQLEHEWHNMTLAENAYKFADAMLKVRNKE